jgi:hypothetical protein
VYFVGAVTMLTCHNHNRWEDFEYTYIRPENRFAYFGNGWTSKEQDPEYDMVSYLKPRSENDLRDLHERWWDL